MDWRTRPRKWKSLLLDTYRCWMSLDTFQLGAALAYYAIFAIGPIFIILVTVAGAVYGEEAAKGQLISQLESWFGADVARALQSMLAHSYASESTRLASLVGVGTILIGATGFFVQLKYSLNQIWQVEPPSMNTTASLKSLLLQRITSFGVILVLGGTLIALTVTDTLVSAFGELSAQIFRVPEPVLRYGSVAISLVFLWGGLATLYRFLPDTEVPWKSALAGASFTAIVLTLGKYLLSLYLGQAGVASAYGAAGSLVVILLAVFVFSQALFLGAIFARMHSKQTLGA